MVNSYIPASGVSFIYSGIFYKNKFAIGKDNNLLVKISDDLKFFKHITTNNTIVIGRKTFDSIGKPLPNRKNIVLSTQKGLKTEGVEFMTLDMVNRYIDESLNENIFIIGGAEIFKRFTPNKIYITHIIPNDKLTGDDDLVFVDPPSHQYKLIGYSPTYEYAEGGGGSYKHLIYQRKVYGYSIDYEYNILCRQVLQGGEERNDRTNVGTVSKFGQHLSFDLQCGFPLLTSKTIPWKHVIEELLWFMRGDTDARILEQRGVKIWKGNTSREFLDSRGLYQFKEGILGKGYGWQFRFFGAKYVQGFADTKFGTPKDGFDQLEYVINEIKTNPDSRRILMCYWNPCDFDEVALPPCHYSCQFYVRDDKYLDCLFNMRSTDVALGLPFNIASYAAFTHIIAKKCDLEPGQLVYNGGDVHIYKNHVEGITTQLTRTAKASPKLIVSDVVRDKDIRDITIDDFTLVGYFPMPTIKMEMAV